MKLTVVFEQTSFSEGPLRKRQTMNYIKSHAVTVTWLLKLNEFRNKSDLYSRFTALSSKVTNFFFQKLRNHRTQLGLTQQEAARSIHKLIGRKISQTLISRFETNQLHPKNTLSLMPDLERWIRKSR